MIKYFQIQNFKSLKTVSFPLEKLNLFLGMNGMGKSSVIQALLLLRQSFWRNNKNHMDCLYINGDLISLGTGKDIVCQNASENIVRFYIQCSEEKKYDFKYEYKPTVSEIDQLNRVKTKYAEKYDIPLFLNDFFYLSAEHIGPRKLYGIENWQREGVTNLGTMGEYVVPFLAMEGEKIRVSDNLCIDAGKTNRLIDQVSAWMSEISPGIRLKAELVPLLEKAKLLIDYRGKRLISEPFLPINVGFGISYVLPLIVELLISGPNSLILIENPESHLHPKGQSMMARLIALTAANGSQIICESHSDHIINGIRVATKQGEINSEDLSVYYFDKNREQETNVINISVDANGNLSDYPAGLLDEWGLLMAELI